MTYNKQNQLFFDQLHIQLAEKYKTAPSVIKVIRIRSISNNESQMDIIKWAVEKKNRPRRYKCMPGRLTRRKSKTYYQQIINIIAQSNHETWLDITKHAYIK